MSLRDRLVAITLEWEKTFGIAPSVTSAVSEYDAARLMGCTEADYARGLEKRTAVSKGYDFACNGLHYQVKANRPSGRVGSKVTLVAKPRNYDWDYLIWIHYEPAFTIREAWLWSEKTYREKFDSKNILGHLI